MIKSHTTMYSQINLKKTSGLHPSGIFRMMEHRAPTGPTSNWNTGTKSNYNLHDHLLGRNMPRGHPSWTNRSKNKKNSKKIKNQKCKKNHKITKKHKKIFKIQKSQKIIKNYKNPKKVKKENPKTQKNVNNYENPKKI